VGPNLPTPNPHRADSTYDLTIATFDATYPIEVDGMIHRRNPPHGIEEL
jgi:hypothetical protein